MLRNNVHFIISLTKISLRHVSQKTLLLWSPVQLSQVIPKKTLSDIVIYERITQRTINTPPLSYFSLPLIHVSVF